MPMIPNNGRPPRVRRATQLPPPPPPPRAECCPMVAAVRSVRQGRFRLARRYAVMSVRLIAARIV